MFNQFKAYHWKMATDVKIELQAVINSKLM